jgi:hypothetical protein
MFCPNPFDRIEIKADGRIYCCCEGWLPRSLGNVLDGNLLDLCNSAASKEIRTSILDGSFRYCKACPYLPGPGGPILEHPEPWRTASSDLSVDTVGTLKLDYDQTCQLQCPSCRIAHSRDFVNANKVQRIHEAVVGSGVLERTKRLYVTGAGDPFASPLYWNFLCNLHQHILHPDLTLFLHTNGLLFDQYHWDAMEATTRERVTEVGISVDAATEKTYQYIRGASWNKLWANITFINRLQTAATSRSRQIMLGMFYTVQVANFRELIPFVRLAWNHKVSWISVTALRNWGTYSPDDYRSRAVHLPGHPDYAEFRQMISDPQLTSPPRSSPRIILDSFNPEFTDQDIICNPDALLPENKLVRKTEP